MKTNKSVYLRQTDALAVLRLPLLRLRWALAGLLLLSACLPMVPSTPTPGATSTPANAALVVLPTVTNTSAPDRATTAITPNADAPVTLTPRQAVTASATRTSTPPTWITHTVVAGDTLSALASRYDTAVAALQAANGLTTDMILVGQQLRIPLAVAATPETDTVAFATTASDKAQVVATPAATRSIVQPSPLDGAFAAAYPATLAAARFTLHYTPGTRAAAHPQWLVEQVAAALAHHEELLGVELSGRFDVYVAGTLFAAPDQALRGRSFSAQRRFFFLDDGSGTLTDQQYIMAHELTHLFTWNTFGAPASVMLHEGVGVYAGMALVAGREFLPLDQFCSAYLQASVLPRVARDLRFMGHIRDLENYYSAGCFVEFLIEQAGPEKFGRVYVSGNYAAVYGKSLLELEAEWLAALADEPQTFTFAPGDLVRAVDAVKAAYAELFSDFRYTPAQMAHYDTLDAIRIALLEGRIETVKQYFGW